MTIDETHDLHEWLSMMDSDYATEDDHTRLLRIENWQDEWPPGLTIVEAEDAARRLLGDGRRVTPPAIVREAYVARAERDVAAVDSVLRALNDERIRLIDAPPSLEA